MAKAEKSTWLKEIVVGVAIAGIGGLFSLIPGGWMWLWAWIGALWRHLGQSSAVPNWLLYVLGAVSISTVALIAWAFMARATEAPWKSYVEDVFDGVRWRWSFAGNSISSLRPYCAQCDTALVRSESHASYGQREAVALYCERCGHKCLEREGSFYDLEGAVGRRVDRNIRAEEWQQIVEGR